MCKFPRPESEIIHDIICPCSGTTETQIIKLIQQGVVSLDEISRITGALSGCGGCEYAITTLVAEQKRNNHA